MRRLPTLLEAGLKTAPPPTMTLDAYLDQLRYTRDSAFVKDAYVQLPEGTFGAEEQHLFARSNKVRDYIADASMYHWK